MITFVTVVEKTAISLQGAKLQKTLSKSFRSWYAPYEKFMKRQARLESLGQAVSPRD